MKKIMNLSLVFMVLVSVFSVAAAPVTVKDGALNVSGNFWVNLNKLFVDSSGGNVGVGTNNPTAPLEVNGLIKSTNWSNVTITQSQISNFQQTIDTNETTRVNALVNTDCPGTDKVIGVYDNGTVVCGSDVDTDTDTQKKADGFYLTNDSTTIFFNETKLNQTIDLRDDDTTYTNGTGISLSGNTFSVILSYFQSLFVELTDSFGGDVSGTYDNLQVAANSVLLNANNITGLSAFDTNETTRVNALVNTDCSGTDKVIGVLANGTVLCGADTDTYNSSADFPLSKLSNDVGYVTNNSNAVFKTLNVTTNLSVQADSTHALVVRQSDGTDIFRVDTANDQTYTGQLRPRSNATYSIGTASGTWYRNLYLAGNASMSYIFANGSYLSDVCLSNGINCDISNNNTLATFVTDRILTNNNTVNNFWTTQNITQFNHIEEEVSNLSLYIRNNNASINLFWTTQNTTQLNHIEDEAGNLSAYNRAQNTTMTTFVIDSDTNETTRVNALVDTDCSGTDKVTGVLPNGTVVCGTDLNTGSSKQGDGVYLTNDSTIIYFNETKLNETIDFEAGNLSLYNRNNNASTNLFWTTQNTTQFNHIEDEAGNLSSYIRVNNATMNNFWITQNTTQSNHIEDEAGNLSLYIRSNNATIASGVTNNTHARLAYLNVTGNSDLRTINVSEKTTTSSLNVLGSGTFREVNATDTINAPYFSGNTSMWNRSSNQIFLSATEDNLYVSIKPGDSGFITSSVIQLFNNVTIGEDFGFTAANANAHNLLNIFTGSRAPVDGKTGGITFWENSAFGMSIGYDGTGTGGNNYIVFYNDSDTSNAVMKLFNNGNVTIYGETVINAPATIVKNLTVTAATNTYNLTVRDRAYINSPTLSSTYPLTPLVVKAETAGTAIRLEETGAGTEYYEIGVNGNGDLEFAQDGGPIVMSLEDATENVGIGTLTPTSWVTLDVDGAIEFDINTTLDTVIGVCKVEADGTAADITLTECSTTPGDIAEMYPAETGVSAGDIVYFKEKQYTFTEKAFDPYTGQPTLKNITSSIPFVEKATAAEIELVAGVVSTNPYQVLGKGVVDRNNHPVPLAIIGRVPVKVIGTIAVGDRITLSNIAGVGTKAKKGEESIGIALNSYSSSTVGRILMMIK